MIKQALVCCALLAICLSTSLAAQSGVTYIYDELGRLVGVIDANGDAAAYHYDAVGNLLSITRTTANQVSIIEYTPNDGSAGTSITIYGTGFSSTPANNTVTLNGTALSVTSASSTKLIVTVPSGATSGPLSVTTPNGTATSATSFTVGVQATGPSISSFSPTIGTPGTAVTVSGSGFDAVAANDRVSFNISYATPGTVTNTQIPTTVPPSGTSGHIAVATPLGTAVSSSDFFVPPPPYTASDVAVGDRATVGTDKTISISTSGKIGLVLYDLPAGHRASVKFSGVTIPSTNVSLIDPYGHASSPVSIFSSGFIEPARSPVSGTTTILIDPAGTYTGNATLHVYDVPDDLAGTITPGGSSVTFTLGTPGQNGRWSFSGTAGQRVSLQFTNGTIASSTVTIFNPDGTQLGSPASIFSTGFIDTQTLPATGTYSILVDPNGASTGNLTMTLYDVPADYSGSIVAGGSPVTATMNTPGQNGSLTFSGTAGHRVSLTIGAGPLGSVRILNPDGSLLASGSVGVVTSFIEPQTLATSGTYTITVDPTGAGIGSVTFTLYDVPADVTGTITPGGASQNVTITNPGQNGILTFSETAGHRVSLLISSGPSGSVQIRKSDNTVLASASSGIVATFVDPITLPATDTYNIFVNPSGNATGTVTLTLYDVPADTTGSVTVNGSSVGVTLSTPGQNGTLTFSGTSGQQATVHITNNTMGLVTIKLLKPDGTQLTSTSSSSANFNLTTQTLSVTGTYTIVIDPFSANTGSLSVSVTNP